MGQTTYSAVAEARAKELGTRIGLGVFIGVAAFQFAPSPIPLIWFLCVLVAQLADYAVSKSLIGRSDQENGPLRRMSYVMSAGFNAVLFVTINLHLWFSGGEAGRWFALLASCGGLLHTSMKMHPSRTLLVVAAWPHAATLLGLPLVSALISPGRDGVTTGMVMMGGLLYVAHLVVGTRQWQTSNLNLRAAKAEAERASAAKSEFLATVSHEIRTPMNAVLSAAHLLGRTDLTEEQTEHVAMLTNAGDVLMSLLNDVLDISKIEAGQMHLEEADFDVAGGLPAIMRLWEPHAHAKTISLRLAADATLPAMIRTDPLRLRQILFNLMSNAIKFTDQGSVTLRAGRCGGPDGERLWFEVIDTGCGIEPEAIGRLFRNFEQARADSARVYGGTGLGLAISHRLAEMMGGSLGVESTLGVGSIFRLDLPLVVSDAQACTISEAALEETPASERTLSILVADDHEVNRRIVSLFLAPLGWRLTMVENGAQAVEAAQTQAFDAILMDMQMPVMNGVDATRAIRGGAGPNSATPVVALTANALGHHRAMWADVGVQAFLTKPIDPRLLISTLIAAGDRRASQLPNAA